MTLSGLINIVLNVLLMALLVFGLVQCKKHSFMAGFYFFLILIVNQIAPYLYRNYMYTLIERDTSPPMGLSIGELVMWLSLISRFIEVVAFSFIVIGLFRLWKSKKTVEDR